MAAVTVHKRNLKMKAFFYFKIYVINGLLNTNRILVAMEKVTEIGKLTSGKDYVKAVYCHPAYLTYMQSTS